MSWISGVSVLDAFFQCQSFFIVPDLFWQCDLVEEDEYHYLYATLDPGPEDLHDFCYLVC